MPSRVHRASLDIRSPARLSLMHGVSHAKQTASLNLFPRAPRGHSHSPTSSRPSSLSARAWSISLSSSSTFIQPVHSSFLSSTYSGVPYLPSEDIPKLGFSTRCASSHRWAESSIDRTACRRKICSHPTGRDPSTRHSPHTDNGTTGFASAIRNSDMIFRDWAS